MPSSRILLFCYGVVFIFLALYSFTQIDLNLTLSSHPAYQSVQQKLIRIGYYDRPLSTGLALGSMIALFVLWGWAIYLATTHSLTRQSLLVIVGSSALLALGSYPSFSHDLFNYMFDARIVTLYGANPYLHKAIDFPDDLWIRFMHWTHRTYPYGPVWLLVTVPFSFLGMGKFVMTLLLFKMMFALFHIGNVWFIWALAGKWNPKQRVLTTVLYALNPLVLIESLVSPHNEVIMVFFFLAALYLLIVKTSFWSSVGLLTLSIAIKFVTAAALPVFLFMKPLREKWGEQGMLLVLLLLLLVPLAGEIWNREPYSWYLLPIVAVSGFIEHWQVRLLSAAASAAVLVRYLPYLYFGDYQPVTYYWENWASLIAAVSCLAVVSVWTTIRRTKMI